MRAFRARTLNIGKIEVAELDELAEPTRCSSSKVGFGLAGGVASFRRVESDQADVGMLTINLDRIAVDDPDIGRIDWLCVGWQYRNGERSDAG